jgi:hypothetical protein
MLAFFSSCCDLGALERNGKEFQQVKARCRDNAVKKLTEHQWYRIFFADGVI